ncbi:MAG: transcriptional repressor [Patescibacteria group bacterium]
MQRRNTKNKKLILDLFENRHLLTAQEVSTLLPTLDASTVYRNLERFAADGVLRKVYAEPGLVSYELANELHDHFVCDECSTVAEIHVPEAVLRVSLPQDIQMLKGGIIVHGLCRDCRE